jgi:hypothetical protein
MEELSELFKIVAEEKKKKKLEIESLVGDSFEKLFIEQLQPKKKKIIQKKIQEPQIVEVVEVKKDTLIEKSLGLLSEPSDTKHKNDPITPLDQKFATFDDLQKHYSTFLSRIQQQLSTLGGGGETRLEFLDDVDRNSAKTDNYFLKYDATLKKWIGDPADGVGITSIVSITGVTTYYQANDADDYIGVSANVPVTIVLPQIPSYGKKLIVKDEGNQINTYNITVQAGIGKSVENDISVIMSSNHQSFSFFYNGSNWYIV